MKQKNTPNPGPGLESWEIPLRSQHGLEEIVYQYHYNSLESKTIKASDCGSRVEAKHRRAGHLGIICLSGSRIKSALATVVVSF